MATGHSNVRNFSAALLPHQAQAGGSDHRTGALPAAVTVTTGRGNMAEVPGGGDAYGGPIPASFPSLVLPTHSEFPPSSVLPDAFSPPT